MTEEEIQKKLAQICDQIEAVQSSIDELLLHLPEIRPYPDLYKAAFYLQTYHGSLEIGRTNVIRIINGQAKLPPKRYV